MAIVFKLLTLSLISVFSKSNYSSYNSLTSVEVEYNNKSLTFAMPCEPQCEFLQEHKELKEILKSSTHMNLTDPLEVKSSMLCKNYQILNDPLENFNYDILAWVVNDGDFKSFIVQCTEDKSFPVLLQISKTQLNYLISAIDAILINEHLKNHKINIGVFYEKKGKEMRTDRALQSCNCAYGCVRYSGYTCYSCSEFCNTCDSIVNTKVGYLSGLLMNRCSSVSNCFANCAVCTTWCSECNTGFGSGTGGCVCASSCTTCYPGCKTCSGGSNGYGAACTECEKGYFLVSWGCIKCPSYCADCTSTECLECVSGTLISGTCTDCDSISPFSVSGLCLSCNSECKTCEDSNKCLTCIDSNSDPSPTQGCVCREKFYSTTSLTVDGSCKSCNSECETCQEADVCLTCIDSNSEPSPTQGCVCKEKFYSTTSLTVDGSCKSCNSECLTCQEDDICLTCIDSNSEPSPTQGCVCKEKFYSTSSLTVDGSCKSCNSECLTCQEDDICLTCIDSNSEPSPTQGCVCKEKFYSTSSLTVDGTCRPCHAACGACSQSDLCSTCIESESTTSDCKCNTGYYFFGYSGDDICAKCDQECQTCSESDKCLTCIDSNAIPDAQKGCVCKYGYYNKESLTNNGSCLPCNNNCKSCTDDLKCTLCIDSNAIPDTLKGCKCKNGYYNTTSLSKDSTCEACSSDCLTCSDKNICTSCQDPNETLTSQGECKCEEKFYKKIIDGKSSCEPCNAECSSCTSSTSCITCISSFTLISSSGSCYCEPGYYNVSVLVEKTSCLKCSKNCLTCSENEKFCTSCSNNFFLYKNSCVKECPEGFKGEKKLCVKCLDGNCEESNSESDSSSSTENADYMSFAHGASYYPFTISTVGITVTMIGFKLIFTTMQAGPLLLSFSGIISTCCGGFIFACLAYSTTPGHSKRLLSKFGSSGDVDAEFVALYVVTLFIIIEQLIFNMVSTLIFYLKYFKEDRIIYTWKKNHSIATSLIFSVSCVFNFNVLHLFYCRIFNLSCFSAKFENMFNVRKLMMKLGIIFVVFICGSWVTVAIYLIIAKDRDQVIWNFALDMLIINVFFSILQFLELVKFWRLCKTQNSETDLHMKQDSNRNLETVKGKVEVTIIPTVMHQDGKSLSRISQSHD